MTIAPISFAPMTFAPVTPIAVPSADDLTTAAGSAASGAGEAFGAMLARGVESLAETQATAETLAVQAATGDLTDVHDYTIAATQAQLATELTVAIRNKAVEAFGEIMRMQI